MADLFLSHISKSYNGKTVLHDFSARIPEYEISCIMGPSGAGKTTLLRILMGLEQPDRGEISGLEGKKISAVFQEDRLLKNLSPVSNIRLVSPGLSVKRVITELHAFGLIGCERQPVCELSGGMCRRVAILRALLADSQLLILDEPFQGLDTDTRERVMSRTRLLMKGKTVIFVTHDPGDPERLGASQVLSLP